MKAMILPAVADLAATPAPLVLTDVADPIPGKGELLVRVTRCGVCHTELDEIEGRTPPPRFPVIPGHQVVGTVAACGAGTSEFTAGDRVGIAWIYSACGSCLFCRSGRENLCPSFRATGRDVNGGYAELMVAPEGFVHLIPAVFSDSEAAPLLCAGAIGYRSLRLTGLQQEGRLGLSGFGASGHLVLKLVRHLFPQTPVFVFARSEEEHSFALGLGAVWAGTVEDRPPELLDAIIDTTPVWTPVLGALKHLQPGGRLIINAIRKESHDRDILTTLDYPAHLWMEKEIKSVANVTRRDVREFLHIAASAGLRPEIEEYPLERANEALRDLKSRRIRGAKVLVVS
jgi:propanol-preferring alcohol dehydrogenase